MQIKSDSPEITRNQIEQRLGYSICTIKRYIDQIKMSTPYNRKSSGRKNLNTQEPSVNTLQTNGGECENSSFFGKKVSDKDFNNN